MNEIKDLLGNVKTRFMSLSKSTRNLVVVILAVMVIGMGAVEMLVGDDGPRFGDEGSGMKQNAGNNEEGHGGNGGEGGFGKEGATRSLSSSFFQLAVILIGIVVIALVVKPKKIAVIKQHVLREHDEECNND